MARSKADKTLAFLERMEMDNPEPDWSCPSEYPDLSHYKTIAVDLETRDPNLTTRGPGWPRKDGYVVGIAIAAGDNSWYFPIRHERGQNMDPKFTIKWMKKQMATPHVTKLFHNATYDVGWLLAEGIEVQGPIIDTMIAAPLIDENRFSYSLNLLGRDYVGETKSEKALRAAAEAFGLDPKGEMWRLPAKYVGEYAEQDAALTLRLWDRLRSIINEQDLHHIFNLETSLIPLMVKMRSNGVRVDLDRAEQVKEKLTEKCAELTSQIKDITGVEVNPWASASVAKVFEALNLSYPMTDSARPVPSFTKNYLQAHPHEVAQMIVKLREFDKAGGTFVDSILRHEHNGRIFTEFHQLRNDGGGTVTGRFSSSNPNLQQIPARDPDIRRMIRGLFLPEEGTRWGSFDYSSQEPRLLVHFAASMPDAMRHPVVDKIVEEYNTGDVDLHQIVADIIGLEGAKGRKAAKVVNLGIMYGMGKGKLAAQLGISTEEAKDLLDKHEEKVPFVRQLAKVATQRASENGQIRTLLGRSCRFDKWEPKTFGYSQPLTLEEANKKYGGVSQLRRAFTYKALNKLIQGSAADQTKKAMADCFEAGLTPLLTVHDELCFSIEGDDQARQIKDIMENGLSDVLKVPSKVDFEAADDWGGIEG
jgi:DNA polymerase I-like protein with 3'-5' exonuclease and polymerase domains